MPASGASICGTLSRRLGVPFVATRRFAHRAFPFRARPAPLAPAHRARRSRQVSGVAAGALSYDRLDPLAREKIDNYLDILLDWNSKMNLTAIKDRPSAISRHINDSLAILPAMDRAVELSHAGAPVRIVDVGSGAGLPGLIFATLRPGWRVTLLDSLNKRCTFNTAAAEAMGLGNVDVLWRYAAVSSVFIFMMIGFP